MLRVAMGGAKSDDEYNKLPRMSNPSKDQGPYKSQIAKFFQTGFWLQDDDTNEINEMIKGASINLVCPPPRPG